MFDTSVAAVFTGCTDPALLAGWLGDEGAEVRVDAVTGGTWRCTMNRDGRGLGYWGSFHEVTHDRRIVFTCEPEGSRGQPALHILTFTSLEDGRCLLQGQLSVPPGTTNVEADEVDNTLDRFASLLARKNGDVCARK